MEYKLPGNIKIQKTFNPSFLFDKCLSAKEYNLDSKDKLNTLKDIANSLFSDYKFGNVDVYTAYKNRMESVANGLKNQGYVVRTFMLKSVSGLCIGMGRDSAIENGITLERNLGIPIIPSSSIKGVIRSYVTLYGTDEEKSKINIYFGSDDDDNPKSGEVDFLNAYMISGNESYKVDIINNHFQEYYSEGKAPNDWFSPNPVYFLRISEGKVFEFTILGRDEKIVSEVQNLIEKAFKEVGVGGKTSVGYGRMIKV
ncbi:MAG: type III-B CRISPR module RAMP protein Cmr6 [Athalassotoga sp.]|uniref:type III-B CRISPR module RAMP protein Cmr6 n=1 Tax=Athalassotoga sp. TaxID=2022597 RepID=UPI003D01F745